MESFSIGPGSNSNSTHNNLARAELRKGLSALFVSFFAIVLLTAWLLLHETGLVAQTTTQPVCDPTGLVLCQARGPGDAIAGAGWTAALCIYDWQSPAYLVVFHFVFLLPGFGLRGLDSGNIMFLKFVALTSALMCLPLLMCGLAYLHNAFRPAPLNMDTPWFCVLTLPLLLVAHSFSVAATAVSNNVGDFPQFTHAMV